MSDNPEGNAVSAQPGVPQPVAVRFDVRGLVPVVAQDERSGTVLLLAYMNAEALRHTLDEGVLVLWSRSRQALWRKGAQSGNVLRLRELRLNCEGNSLLARVRLTGAGACHEGYVSCYHRRITAAADGTFAATVVEPRTFDPAVVYGPARPAPDAVPDQTSPASIEHDARALYAGYEHLRDTPPRPASRTAALLHAPDRAATARLCLGRAREELEELRGVIAGTHVHRGVPDDAPLEAGQVGYWAQLAAVAAHASYESWQPHIAWIDGWAGSPASTPAPNDNTLAACAGLLRAAGALCHAVGVHPARVVATDLAALRASQAGVEP